MGRNNYTWRSGQDLFHPGRVTANKILTIRTNKKLDFMGQISYFLDMSSFHSVRRKATKLAADEFGVASLSLTWVPGEFSQPPELVWLALESVS